jgi:glycosyltransferase involved in cell wall biosynthesis
MTNAQSRSPILFLSHEFPPLGGGAGRLLLLLCEELHRRGVALRVWTSRLPVENASSREFPVTAFFTGRIKRFDTNVPAMVRYIAAAIGAARRWQGAKPSIVISNMAIPGGIAGAAVSKILAVPHVIWHHGSDVHLRRARGASAVFRQLLRIIWRSSSLNLFVSESMERMARSYGMKTSSAIVPVAVDGDFSSTAASSDNRFFLFAGRMEAVKNPLLLLDAISLLAEKNECRAVRFLFVGEGKLFGTLKGRVNQRELTHAVELRNAVPFSEMLKLYQSAYAVVLPSVIEGFPLTALEAGRCGVPAIGARTPGIVDAVEDGGTGLLFSPGDARSLASAIARLHGDAGLRNKLGENARLRAQQFTLTAMADAFQKAIQKLP